MTESPFMSREDYASMLKRAIDAAERGDKPALEAAIAEQEAYSAKLAAFVNEVTS